MNAIITQTKHRQGKTSIIVSHCALKNSFPESMHFAGATCKIGSFCTKDAAVLCFRSEWGREMTPIWKAAPGSDFVVTSGRSSHGWSPFLFLRQHDRWNLIAVCHSGNWHLQLGQDGIIRFLLDKDVFYGTLSPQERIPLPTILHASCADFNMLRQDFCQFLRSWLPPTRMDVHTVSWNPWWPFEDCDISEEVVLKNARVAKEIGINLIILDAGWFGGTSANAHWTRRRGDWDQEDKIRFPHGLGWLADQIHAMGLQFGIWMEPEGMGIDSDLKRVHPEWEALRDGASLEEPYLCLAAKGAADWLYNQMVNLIERTKADWLKIDFNVDPGIGCNRSDHGHQPGMGLYEHLRNYMEIIDRLRARFPRLVVENCSSGGLRFDLSMMTHTDVCFLSDPDEVAHSLQVFSWLSFLPLERLLHWVWSDTRTYMDGSHVFPGLPADLLPWVMDGALLHPFGFSRDLTALTPSQRDYIKKRIAWYRETIAPLLAEGTVQLVTSPPQREDIRKIDNVCTLSPYEGPWIIKLVHTKKEALLTLTPDMRATIQVFDRSQGGS